MINDMGDEESCTKPLRRWSVVFYGVGHMLNDITSACWFTYLLVFLTDIGLSPRDAAAVMLSGQIADGFTTIFAGELIDRFGHFKIWHGAGSALVAVSFSSVFGGCIPCKILGSNSSTLRTIGYSTFAAIFNVGWAATQVSHMSMVNCITLNSTSRVVLASCRNAFTMVANLSLYGVAFVVFNVKTSNTVVDVENQDLHFLCRLKQGVQGKRFARISWAYWFKKVLYYQVALVYVLTRLVTNVSQAFLAFYVINDLQMAQSSKAVVPAIIYISSFIVSVLLQEFTWTGKRLKLFYSAGGILWIFCGSGFLFLPRNIHAAMYFLSIVIGIANALMMVTAISMQSILVGQDLNGCAFVYGSLSFMDKISCGIALYILESYQNTFPNLQGCSSMISCFSVSRTGLGLIPAICALGGVLVTFTMDLHSTSPKPLMEPLLA
ncbi:hypothetical protein RHGRI_019496 [Rhododendron griersonianum]|uniref:Major facilitator superfamily domain-containing protein 12-like n=1 Tax=Rhododendron griersonianum TaxID=479676 RepID=A0AAV6JCQ6_9ERIC|nr:hypothetical protein RHGRI_019496 [Rhododendron griersonianum]KAG5538966.1 hypothetical protein RHGRI_019496 [Rhododendron griersonianum]KAG5538967.1 hypothetical protein RHGRI_019496 [Rhododendron griersonianum]